jgi:hypothetical protein
MMIASNPRDVGTGFRGRASQDAAAFPAGVPKKYSRLRETFWGGFSRDGFTASSKAGRDGSRFLLAIVALSFWCAVAAADATTDAVEHAERARFAAMVARDTVELDRMLATELYYCHSTGNVENKTQFLETIRTQRVRYHAIDVREINVRILAADVAMVSGLLHFKGSVAGRDVELDLRYLDNYVLRDGRWQLLAWQSTLGPPSGAAPGAAPKESDTTR